MFALLPFQAGSYALARGAGVGAKGHADVFLCYLLAAQEAWTPRHA
jgi:hypothetical protein